MEGYMYIIAVFIFFALFGYTAIQSKKNADKQMRKRIKDDWGNLNDRVYEQKEYEKIASYYKNYSEKAKDKSVVIDDITWNDLDMDNIYKMLNTTYSSAGEEYLYKSLRILEKNEQTLKERNRLITLFSENEESRKKFQEIFYLLGRTKKTSLYEFVNKLNEIEAKSNLNHYIKDILLLISIIVLFIKPVIGIFALIAMVSVNMYTYYGHKSRIGSYFTSFSFIIRMQDAALKITKLDLKELEAYNNRLSEIIKNLAPIKKGSFLMASKNVSGSISDVLLEYLRMLTHIDIIKFNNMLKLIKEKSDDIEELFEILGLIEMTIAIGSFREYCDYHSKPEFTENLGIEFEDIYHPCIKNPVSNSMKEAKSVLLTGSNASGKSTFLKTVAINAIFAQTIYTCTSKKYKAPFYSIYSSMALRDNLLGNESYYIVEIKSLKRIVDAIENGTKVLCFVDEVLRGTNTVERIAASSKILGRMADKGAFCFAATHDIELTHILEGKYSNYHFSEEVNGNDIVFNYNLYEGRATSRNAIKLLRMIGYEEEIVKEAEGMASEFVEKGTWN